MLRFLNQLVIKIYTIYTESYKVKKVNFNIAKNLKIQLLLVKSIYVILTINM